MNRLTPLFTLCIVATIILFSSCKDDDNGTTFCNWSQELAQHSQALSDAALVYANDPTTANCEAYRQAVQNYLNEAEDLNSCVPTAELSAYQQAIDDAQQSIDALQC